MQAHVRPDCRLHAYAAYQLFLCRKCNAIQSTERPVKWQSAKLNLVDMQSRHSLVERQAGLIFISVVGGQCMSTQARHANMAPKHITSDSSSPAILEAKSLERWKGWMGASDASAAW